MAHEFAQAETEDRRLAALRLLTEANDYTANEYLLAEALAKFGHRPSRDVLRADCAWLDEQGLVVAQQPGGVWVLTLTARGEDVAAGRARVPGVKRPRPGA